MTNFCIVCGRQLTGNHAFCTGCGSSLAPRPDEAPVPSPDVDHVPSATPIRLPDMRLATIIVVGVAVLAVTWPLGGWALSRGSTAVVEAPAASVAPQVEPQQDLPAGPFTCTNNLNGFAITVPRSWAKATSEHHDCSQFAVPLGTSTAAALSVMPDQGVFESVQPQGDVIEQEDGNVGDVRATFYKSTLESEGQDLYIYGYILDNSGTAFVVALVSRHGVEIPKTTKKVFDQVVRQIEFD